MKNAYLMTILALLFSAAAIAQDEEITLQYSNPDKPGHLKIHRMSGGIRVIGHNSNQIIVKAPQPKLSQSIRHEGGLRRIQASNTNLDIVEEDNRVKIHSSNRSSAATIEVLVPIQTSVNLSCLNDGDIYVEGISGEIEARNTNGSVTIKAVKGSVIAHALNEELTVEFEEMDMSKPMSFTSLNGNIDVTFPGDLNAQLLMSTSYGEIFSSFDVKLSYQTKQEKSKKQFRNKLTIKKQLVGTIGKGGPEMTLKTFNGDIYIRKKE